MGPRDSHSDENRTARASASGAPTSLLELDEPAHDPGATSSVPPPALTAILAEIETARVAVAVALKKVLVGPIAILQPELAQLDAGPPEIDRVLNHVRSLEQAMRSAGGASFYLRDLPASGPDARRASGGPAACVSGKARYLLPRLRPGRVGFGVAVSCDDYRALLIHDDGRMEYPFMMAMGVAPFIAMPPDAMQLAARENEQRYRDHAGHGYFLPTYVKAYADFFAFAVQDSPAALAALLLAERHPQAAADLLREHDAIMEHVSSAALYFLGYESLAGATGQRVRRSLRDSEVARACGMRLVEEIYDWRGRCCRGPVLAPFARGYRDLRVDKLASLAVLRGR